MLYVTGAVAHATIESTSEPAHRSASYDDLLALPEGVIGEIVDGQLYPQPCPAIPHARVASVLGMELGGAFDRGRYGPGGWIILDEPELHLEKDVVVPDLAGWRRERLADVAMDQAHLALAPDWVCEVLSPGNEIIDRTVKMDLYARQAVSFLWLIQPRTRSLEAYRLEGAAWLRLGTWHSEARVRASPFEAWELELGALWV